MTGSLTVDDPPRVSVRPLASAEPGWEDTARPGRHTTPGTTPPAAGPPVAADPGPDPGHRAPPQVNRAAHAVLRTALEVVDGLRPASRVGTVFPAPVLGMLTDLARIGVPGRSLGNARLRRVYVDPVGPTAPSGTDGEYEVCATYARGPRLFAVAARIRTSGSQVTCSALRLV